MYKENITNSFYPIIVKFYINLARLRRPVVQQTLDVAVKVSYRCEKHLRSVDVKITLHNRVGPIQSVTGFKRKN